MRYANASVSITVGVINTVPFLDSELLAEVYLELCGGRQTFFNSEQWFTKSIPEKCVTTLRKFSAAPLAPRPHAASEHELARHRTF